MTENVLLFERLTANKAVELIRDLCKDSSRIEFTSRAELRMAQRKISKIQVIRCLEAGRIVEGPSRAANGNWELRMEGLAAGDLVKVAAALDNDGEGNQVIVITVMN